VIRLLRFLGSLCAAAAASFLGFAAARLIWDAPRLLLPVFTEAQLHSVARRGSWVQFIVLPPADAGPVAHAMHAGGGALLALACLLFLPASLNRLPGWSRVAAVHGVYWLAVHVAVSVFFFFRSGRGQFASAFEVMKIPELGSLQLHAPLAAGVCALAAIRLFQCFRGFAAGQRGPRARLRLLGVYVLAPVVLLSLVAPRLVFRLWWLPWFWQLAPALLAGLIAAAAAWSQPFRLPPLRPGLRGAAASVILGAVAAGALFAFPRYASVRETPAFETWSSRRWTLHAVAGSLSKEEKEALAGAADRRLEAMAQRLGVEPPAGLNVYLYASTEDRRGATGGRWDEGPFWVDRENAALHQLLTPSRKAADPRGEALLLMHTVWGEPASMKAARALARFAAGEFFGHELADYARRIACEERPYSLEEVFASNGEYLSPLVRDALAGAWVQQLAETNTSAVLQRLYRSGLSGQSRALLAQSAGAAGWEEFDRQWQQFLTVRDCPGDPRPRRNGLKYHQGVSFSHEVGPDWGYGSDLAQRQLEQIRALGANSVAIVPYVFTRAPRETAIYFRTDETDARILRTIRQARRLGLGVALKPHLWSGGFTGGIKFENDQNFRRWFVQYRRWILHFARMAELFEAELLVIGNELPGISTREEAWRKLIAGVRRIYSGPVTYAAHWDGEYALVPFWDALDLIGVNFYFPLAEEGETPKENSPLLQERVGVLRNLAQAYEKPVLFTEVGFPSLATAAARPWAETAAPIDLELQRRCYEAVFKAFSFRPWFGGMYWWKWPSHGVAGPYDPTHYPAGKPAEGVLRTWFHRPEGPLPAD